MKRSGYYYSRKHSIRYKLEKWFYEESRNAVNAVIAFIAGLFTCAILFAFIFVVPHVFH